MQLYFFSPDECPTVYVDIYRAFIREKINLHEMKNEKNYVGFCIPKVWQILERFSGVLSWA